MTEASPENFSRYGNEHKHDDREQEYPETPGDAVDTTPAEALDENPDAASDEVPGVRSAGTGSA
jgi:hypothetical protein